MSGELKKAVKSSSSDKKNGSNDPLVAAGLRRDFYSDGLSTMKRYLLASLVVFCVSVVLLIIAINKESGSSYIAVGPDGSVTKMVPIAQPNQKDAAVSNWAAGALVDTFDFSYYNIRSHLSESKSKWFTDNGGTELLNGMEKTGNFNAIEKNKLVVGLSIDHVPLVAKKGFSKRTNAYTWLVEAQATITYRTQTDIFSNKVIFTLTVVRRSLQEEKQGLGIDRITMEITGKSK